MLPREHRLTRRADFTEVVRRGRRAVRPLLTLHADLPGTPDAAGAAASPGAHGAPDGSAAPSRAGLVVSKAVGGSVVRSRVSRRLRHLLRDRLDRLPPGSRLVVRAAARSAGADSRALGADLDTAIGAVLARHRRDRPRSRAAGGLAAADRDQAPAALPPAPAGRPPGDVREGRP